MIVVNCIVVWLFILQTNVILRLFRIGNLYIYSREIPYVHFFTKILKL